ncbi:MAG: hypothetical protein MZU91_12430 [Desulfosudis oleivorans]|nr:hypothetical protein [Desulfosudis oleivorans]
MAGVQGGGYATLYNPPCRMQRPRRREDDMSMIHGESIAKNYQAGDIEVQALKDVELQHRQGRLRRLRRPLGQRQEHAAQPDRLPRPPQRRHA